MASYIGKNSNGFLTYENEPNAEQTLLKNINDVYPEAELNELNTAIADISSDITATDVTNDLTVTVGDYIDEIIIQKAVKSAKALYIQFSVKVNTRLASASAPSFIIKGITTTMQKDWRILIGVVGPNSFFHAWIRGISGDEITFGCKSMTGNPWEITDVPTFSGIIPLA